MLNLHAGFTNPAETCRALPHEGASALVNLQPWSCNKACMPWERAIYNIHAGWWLCLLLNC